MTATGAYPKVYYQDLCDVPVNGFKRLLTGNSTTGAWPTATGNSAADKAFAFLHSVYEGDGKRAYCPFVGTVESKNLYCLKVYPAPLNVALVQQAYTELETMMEFLCPQPKRMAGKPALDVLVATFSDEEANSSVSRMCLLSEAIDLKDPLMDKGIMSSTFHVLNKPGGRPGGSKMNEPMFVSQIPLVIFRRMHKDDHIFCTTTRGQKAYERFYGSFNWQ